MTTDKQLVYWSGTGVTQRIIEPLGGVPLGQYNGGPCILVFPSYGSPRTGGHVPPVVERFILENQPRIFGVVGIGNIIFGADFCRGARLVSAAYNIPLITEIDMVITQDQKHLILESLKEGECSGT